MWLSVALISPDEARVVHVSPSSTSGALAGSQATGSSEGEVQVQARRLWISGQPPTLEWENRFVSVATRVRLYSGSGPFRFQDTAELRPSFLFDAQGVGPEPLLALSFEGL